MSRRRKILIVAAIVLGVAILVPVIRHYQLRAATEAYIAQLKAQGEPMELAHVIPPPVPPEQNAAQFITNALFQIEEERNFTNSLILKNSPLGMSLSIAPGKIIVGWRQPFIHDLEGYGAGYWYPTNTWGDLGAQLIERQNDLNDFRRLIDKPTFDFHYDYSDPKIYIPTLAPHLSQITMAVQWLEASEYYNLHQNETAKACTDVRAMLAFIKGETDERFEISQLIRFAIARISADATWDILQTTNVSDQDLAQLQQNWESLEFVAPLRSAFLFERVAELQLQNSLRQSPTDLNAQIEWTKLTTEYHYERTEDGTYVLNDKRSFFRKVIDGISTRWDKFRWRCFWSYTDEVRGLQMWGVVIDGTQMLEANNSFHSVQSFVNTNFVRLGFNSVKDNPYAIISQNASSQLVAIRKAASAETTRNIVVAAIALERCELRHHHLPDTLDELVPEFLKSVPTDYMDGQLLRYRRNADGTFLLYSVGENGKDDGGNPAQPSNDNEFPNYDWNDSRALDWVWPQPATEQEIQSYYAHPPK